MTELIQYLADIIDGSLLDWVFVVIAIFALFSYSNVNKKVPYFVDYLLVESAVRVGTLIVLMEGAQNNLLLYSFISFFRFIYGYLIFKDLFESEKWRYSLTILGLAYVLYTTFIANSQELNAICMALVQFWWIIVAMAYLNNTYSNLQIENLWQEPKMWIATGMLFYGVTTFFVYLFSSRIHSIDFKKEALDTLWGFEHIGVLIFCFCCVKAILLARRVN